MPIKHSSTRHDNNKKKRKKLGKKKSSETTADPTVSWSADQFVQAADHALHLNDLEQAVALYTIALEKSQPRDTDSGKRDDDARMLPVEILEKRAAVNVSLDDPQSALLDYISALDYLGALQESNYLPDLSYSSGPVEIRERQGGLYFSMGQLKDGKEALATFEQGLECLREAINLRQKERMVTPSEGVSGSDHVIGSALNETLKQLATAQCTVAELYLTDLCCDEGAEQACESYVVEALKYRDTRQGNPLVDALQTAASLRLSQQRTTEAYDFIAQAYGQMQVGCEALAALVGMRNSTSHSTLGPGGGLDEHANEAMELVETEAVQSLPSFEFRCQTAKLLLECAVLMKPNHGAVPENDIRVMNSIDAAINVLGSLMAENDEVVEIWALAGDAFAHMAPPSVELARYYWDRATEMLHSVKSSLEQQLEDVTTDEEERELDHRLDSVECELAELHRKISDMIESVTQHEDHSMNGISVD